LEYKQKRPGLKALQEAIDEFIVAHEEQQEKVSVSSVTYISSDETKQTSCLFLIPTWLFQEKKEREARAAEDGWAVVHHKGRKKTTDAETGTAVGSVSLGAMQHKMAKMKPKEVDMNFYRFQKREAHLSGMSSFHNKTYYLLFHSVLLHMIEPRLYIAHYDVLGLVSCNAMQFTSHDKM
jgi:ribosomal RNA-processing protein 7